MSREPRTGSLAHTRTGAPLASFRPCLDSLVKQFVFDLACRRLNMKPDELRSLMSQHGGAARCTLSWYRVEWCGWMGNPGLPDLGKGYVIKLKGATFGYRVWGGNNVIAGEPYLHGMHRQGVLDYHREFIAKEASSGTAIPNGAAGEADRHAGGVGSGEG
jgi:hypothetical protein